MSNKKFTVQLEAKMSIDQVKNAVQTMQNELSKLKLPQNIGNQLQGTFSKLSSEIEKFQTLSAKGIGSTKDFNDLASSGNKILQIYNQLANQVKNLSGMSDSQIQKLFPPEIQANIEKANRAMAEYGKAAKASEKDIKDLELEISKAQKETERLIKDKEKLENKKTVSDTLFKQMGKDADEAKIKLEKAQQELIELQNKADGYKSKRKAKGYVDLVDNQIPQKEAEIAKLEQSWNRLKSAKEKALTQTQKDQALEKFLQDIAAAQGKVTQLQNKLNNLKAGNPQSFNQLIAQLNQIKGINLDPTTATMETVSQAVNNLSSNELERLKKAFVQSEQIVAGANGSIDSFGQTIDETRGKVQQLDDRMSQVNMLKSRIQYFFGLTNSIMLFRRAIVSALNTVKELDATMTEAAVVTKFDVNDMWEQLPTYSKYAQDLGISINGMYQATTLYYQQGLKTNEAMQLGVETMKMAKIASMDSTEATKAMTAALRGFNLELNETSAARVNDVYSQLAAVTAADTNQIATAMEKTASIAASANMEFETTAALLAQIIETTQEAPETAGTAMKTIIARFAEVKSLRDQGLASGEDEEGEIIDVNKIQTALRSVGISMEGFFSGEEGLDSVLLKLAEKWGTLDFETQRYIATMAAGSRQQSRFIAMMSDYGRTTELVGQAQNSAGASQKQFEKTQESLATSLNRLKNAWDQFQMGLANNEILKAGIDTLTKFLEIVNKTTDSISGDNGLVKSIISLGVTAAGLKGARAVLSGVMASMGSAATGKGLSFGANLKASFGQEFGSKRKQLIKFDVAGAKAYNTSLKSLQASLNNVTAAEAKLATASKRKKTAAEAALTEAKANAERDLAIATSQVSLATDLSNEQSREAVLLNSQGLSIDHAVIAAKAGATAERYKEIIAQEISNGSTEEEIFARVRATAATEGQYMALNRGIVGRIEEITMTKLGVVSTLASAAAHWLEKKGIDAKNASMLVSLGLVGAAVAAVAALVVLGKHLYDAYKASTLEGRMEAAAEATEKAKEAAESASQAYDDLLSAREGYNELQSQLESLTKGTLEWKAALAESNNQVLELLETYPQLSEYLLRGQHGELEISEAGWDYINEYSANAVANSQTALVASQINETGLDREKIKKNFEDAVNAIIEKTAAKNEITTEYGYTVASPISGLTHEVVKDLYDEYQKNPMFFQSEDLITKFIDNSEYKEWQKETLKKDIEAIQELQNSISELDRSLKENDVVLQAQTEALLQSQASKETYEYEFGKELITGFATGYTKNRAEKEQKIIDQLYTTKDNEFFGSLVSEYDVATSKITGDRLSDLRQLYAKMKNMSVDEIDEDLSADQLAREIASIKATSDTAKKMDEVAQAISKLDASTQRAYSVMLSGDISGATQDFQAVTLEAVAKDLGLTGGADELKELFGIEDDTFTNIKTLVEEAFTKIQSRANNFGINTYQEEFGSATVGQLGAYTDMMLYSTTSEGTTAKLQDGFDKILARANDTQIQQILSAMSTYDFTKEGAGESFVQDLRDIGIVLDETDQTIKDFIEQMDMVNAIFRDFDLSDVYDEVKRGLEEAEEVAESDYLSFEQYEKYAKEGLIDTADWTWNGKGWVNIENGMTELVQALKDNTLSNYNLTKQEAKEQKKWYQDKAKEFDNLQGTYYYDEQGGIYNAPKGVKKAKAVEDLGAYLAQEGLAETIWSQFFATFKEYEQWGKLYKGGFADLETFLAGTETFNPENVILDAEKAWENPYDKFYNTIEKINAELREREKLERAYQRLLKDEASTVQQVLNNSKDQLKNLGAQKGLQQYLMEGKQAEINDLVASSNLKQYATFEDGMIKINWKEIEAVTNEKQGEEIEDYISKLEELRDQYQDAEDALLDIEDQIDEVIDQGKQEYLDLENQIKEAIIDARQEEIDKLSAINETIANSNSKILDSMRQSIEYQRQMRDNQKTEKELAKKQERLAYLKQSSSGAYDLEIMTLEEELAQDQQTYTDSLTDQRLAELEKQNEEARQQRQNQIDILQEQLAYEEANGLLWKEVKDIWEKGIDETGLVPGSKMEGLLKNSSDWKAMSAQQKVDWVDELNENIKAALSWEKLQTALASDNENLKTMINGAAAKVTANLDDHTNKIIKAIEENSSMETVTAKGFYGEEITGQGATKQAARADAIKQIDSQYVALLEKIFEEFGENGEKDPIGFRQSIRSLQGRWEKLREFKTGGLADFTGPAWLDGTKSRPEYILNADQTQAFFKLIDVLSSFKDLDKTSQNSEENVYDIDINVESIDSDYDVDRIAERVKELVLASARYRNNNIL